MASIQDLQERVELLQARFGQFKESL